MKPTFLGKDRPLAVVMIQEPTIADCILTVRNSLSSGADAFGLQIEQLERGERTEKNFRTLFSYMGDKPIYVTDYDIPCNRLDADTRMNELLLALKCGANLIDIPGDTFSEEPEEVRKKFELTENADAVKKQTELAAKIKDAGGEVLISSHVKRFIPAEEVLRIADEQVRRGADVAKIVTASGSDAQMIENLEITRRLKEHLEKPFLYLSVGAYCKIHRVVGPMLGSLGWLCAERYDARATLSQPLLSAVNEIRTHFDYQPNERK